MARILVISALLWAVQVNAQSEAYFRADSIAYNKSVPVSGYFDNWKVSPFRDGDFGVTHNWVEAGVTRNRWSFGVLWRYDYELDFHKDTAEFFYRIQNERELDVGRIYKIDVSVKRFRTIGARLAYLFNPHPTLTAEVGIAYLRGDELMNGSMNGDAIAADATDFDFDFRVSYRYSDDILFERKVNSPNGNGYSVDLNLDWKPLEQLNIQLIIRDLIGRIHWDNAPFTTATGTSETKAVDEQGFASFKPILSGVEGNKNYWQDLPMQTMLKGKYDFSSAWSALAEVYDTSVQTFYGAGAEYRRGQSEWQALVNVKLKALTIGYSRPSWGISFTSDTIHLQDAFSLSLNVWGNWAL